MPAGVTVGATTNAQLLIVCDPSEQTAPPENLVANGPCRVCGDTNNEPRHDCRLVAHVEPRTYRRTTPRQLWDRQRRRWRTEYSYERFTAIVRRQDAPESARAHRSCYHGHQLHDDARYCAAMLLRRLQVGARPPSIDGLTTARWQATIERAGHRCYYCRQPVPEGDSWHKEHAIPLARGGRNHADNIVASCGTCNAKKGTKTAVEFLKQFRAKPPYPPPGTSHTKRRRQPN